MNMFKLNEVLNRIYVSVLPGIEDLEQVLSLEKPEELEMIFNFADAVRKEFCGDGILLRGIIEFSNFCNQGCFYCGLNKNNHKLTRYRMNQEELLRSVAGLAKSNIKTVVLQSGDDSGVDALWLKDIILEVKSKFDLAITLSVGERSAVDYRVWKDTGAELERCGCFN